MNNKLIGLPLLNFIFASLKAFFFNNLFRLKFDLF